MCVSRFHRVVGGLTPTSVLVADSEGRTRQVSLLALDGPPPRPGDWLVVHSGYAIDRVDGEDAEAVATVVAELGGNGGGPGDETHVSAADPGRPTTHRPLPGAAVAGLTAVVSGVSVWVNSYGVKAIHSASVYTTAKNLVAAVLLVVLAGAAQFLRRRRAAPAGTSTAAGRPGLLRWLGLAYVGLIGGGVAFVLFFNGLAGTSAASAAFWRDTLVIWVAAMALPILGESMRWWNGAAVAMLVAGQIVMAGGIGHLAANRAQLLVLASSVLWGIEVIVVKAVLRDLRASTVALARMAVGSAALVVYLAVTGRLGQLTGLDLHQLRWAVLTGALLALYVATWITALLRARAVDVTSVLVGSALVTWLLQTASGTTVPAPRALGLVLIGVGAVAVLWSAARRPEARRQPAAP